MLTIRGCIDDNGSIQIYPLIYIYIYIPVYTAVITLLSEPGVFQKLGLDVKSLIQFAMKAILYRHL